MKQAVRILMGRIRIGRIFLLLGLALLVGACDNPSAPLLLSPNDPDALKGKRWQWVGYSTIRIGYCEEINENNYFTIDSLGNLTGSSGCNSFHGVCNTTPALIEFDSVLTTLLGCKDVPDFAESLDKPAAFKQRDSVLLVIPTSGPYLHLFFRAR